MSPRKPTIDGLDDIDDEDGTAEEEATFPSDLSLAEQRAEDVGLGGAPSDERSDERDISGLDDDQEDER
ncbi:MAG TPA: hypothetical protein VMY76_05775 [Gemmatimonadales bacterium]|nr:hypothetical protein [Gemmatimonadales bacterium]